MRTIIECMQLCHIHLYQKIARKKVARVNAALSLLTRKKAAMAHTSVTRFIEFSVQIYRESRYYEKLIMMSIATLHISYNFICSSCEGNKEVSDSFR